MIEKQNGNLRIIPLDIPDREAITVPVHRAGVLLFSPAKDLGDWKILVTKPVPTGDGNPPFQLAKGSMQVKVNGTMIDVDEVPPEVIKTIPKADFETSAVAGLRELEEEGGAKRTDTKGPLYDAGAFPFRSTSSGKAKAAYMLAAEAVDATKTYPFDRSVTSDTAWVTLKEFETTGREDQRATVRAILQGVEKVRQTFVGQTALRDGERQAAATGTQL